MNRKSGRNTDETFGPESPDKPKGARYRATHTVLELLEEGHCIRP